jgi:hypothetical protein
MDETPRRLTGCALCGRWLRDASEAEIDEALRDLPAAQSSRLRRAKGDWLVCGACGIETLHLISRTP